ncbi:MAG TPA: tetratricopeptide repeat protein, partial [Polyangia bacterium]|nr:tetratricopeptide repeat protein [Polyangia bacterium]
PASCYHPAMTAKRVLILDGSIFPEIYCPVDEWRALLGDVPSDAVHVSAGEAVPDLEPYTHLIVTGSEASITRPEPWYEVEADAVRRAVAAGKAVLGSCFGHQLLALALSGPAFVRASASPEIGWIAVEVAGLGDDELLAGLPRRFHVFAAHFDEVRDLPEPWRVLASSARCAVQAMRYGDRPVWGIQAHPEITPDHARVLLRGFLERALDKAQLVAPALVQPPRDDGFALAIVRRFLAAGGTALWLIMAAGLALACSGAKAPAVEASGSAAQAELSPAARAISVPDSLVPDRPLPGCSLDAPLPAGTPAGATAPALHDLGQERILDRDGAAAVALLTRAAKLDPDDPVVLGDLATALLQCRLYSAAVPRMERAVEFAPTDVDLRANLAQTYQIVERFRDAARTYREAIELDPKDAALRGNLAVVLVVRGELAAAEKQVRAAVGLDPENATYLVNLSYILWRQGRHTDSETEARRAVEVEPGSAGAHNQLGLVLAGQGRTREARAAFAEALRFDPGHKAARENADALEEGAPPAAP